MYAWIWRHLPYGRPGRIIGSVLLVGIVVALLWYVVFPWAEPLLPFDDVQVTEDGSAPGDGAPGDPAGDDPAGDDPGLPAGDEYDVPYSTETNNPAPSPDR